MSFSKKGEFPVKLQELSERHKALGHPARKSILIQLAVKERHVKELARMSPLTSGSISGHLEILRRVNFIDVEVQGLYNFYSINISELDRLHQELGKFISGLKRSRKDSARRRKRSEMGWQAGQL